MQVLNLNATYEPLGLIRVKRATCLVLEGKAEIIEEAKGTMNSAGGIKIPRPSVIRLNYYVSTPPRQHIFVSNKGVLVRDHYVCAYCGGLADTIDHITPRSKGGKNTWDNVTAACRTCNYKKADNLLNELNWTLERIPHRPVFGAEWIYIIATSIPLAWEKYLTVSETTLAIGSN